MRSCLTCKWSNYRSGAGGIYLGCYYGGEWRTWLSQKEARRQAICETSKTYLKTFGCKWEGRESQGVRILFFCEDGTYRSQIAKKIAWEQHGFSAEAAGVSDNARQFNLHISRYNIGDFDLVVNLTQFPEDDEAELKRRIISLLDHIRLWLAECET